MIIIMAKLSVLLQLQTLVPMLSLLLLFPFSLALNQDFCIADLSLGETPSGYPCKPQAAVTADDFYYRGLNTTGPAIPAFNIGISSAFVARFPAVNGLGISAARADLPPRRRRAAALAPAGHRAALRPGRHRGVRLHQRHAQQGLHQDALQGRPYGAPAGAAALPVQRRRHHGRRALLLQQRQPRPADT